MTADTERTGSEGSSLRRAREGRLIGGVAAGIANYFNVDVLLVRIVLVALVFVGGAGIPVYAAMWLLVPDEGSDVAIVDGVARCLRCA